MRKYGIIFILIFSILCGLILVGCGEATSISFVKEEIEVVVGTEFSPEVKISPKKASYVLNSSNMTILGILNNTTVKANRVGVVNLSAVSGGKTATVVVYIRSKTQEEVDPNNPIIKDLVKVNFVITNYEDAGLTTGDWGAPRDVIEGGYVKLNAPPSYSGFVTDCWYTDRSCKNKIDLETTKIYENTTFYAQLIEREQDFQVKKSDTGDYFVVTGLMYENLVTKTLYLPKYIDDTLIEGIADNAFCKNENIEKVIIPDSYKVIGGQAFAGCKNLVTIEVDDNSTLEVIGANAFGEIEVSKEDNTKLTCEKLTTFDIPDSVYKIGGFAFNKCKNYRLKEIPNSLKTLEQYVFSGTKTERIELQNVLEVMEGAFFDCEELQFISGTHNIEKCAKYAFNNTAYYESKANEFYKKQDTVAEDYLFYVDTILADVFNASFSGGTTSSEIVIKDYVTLISDEAFSGFEIHNFTLVMTNTNQANNLVLEEYDKDNLSKSNRFIGEKLFLATSKNMMIAVPSDKLTRYREIYPEYSENLCIQKTIEVSGGTDVLNAGTHKFLYYKNKNKEGLWVEKILYQSYEGNAKEVNLSKFMLDNGYDNVDIASIYQRAFIGLENLETLELGDVKKLEKFAIRNNTKLKSIDFSTLSLPPELDNASIDKCIYGGVPDIFVSDNEQLKRYQTEWAETLGYSHGVVTALRIKN